MYQPHFVFRAVILSISMSLLVGKTHHCWSHSRHQTDSATYERIIIAEGLRGKDTVRCFLLTNVNVVA